MKNFILKNKWLVSVLFFTLLIIIVLLILIKSDNLHLLYNSIDNKIRNISVIVVLIAIITEIMLGWISNYITNFIFPGAEKKILKNTIDIKSDTFEINTKIENQTKKVTIIADETKQILDKINNNEKFDSNKSIWIALNSIRDYYYRGMDMDLQRHGTLKLEPLLEFRKIVSESKMNIEKEIYNRLEIFYSDISKETTQNIFEPMKKFLDNKNELFPNEIEKIQLEINKSKAEIVSNIEDFMKNNKKQLLT